MDELVLAKFVIASVAASGAARVATAASLVVVVVVACETHCCS